MTIPQRSKPDTGIVLRIVMIAMGLLILMFMGVYIYLRHLSIDPTEPVKITALPEHEPVRIETSVMSRQMIDKMRQLAQPKTPVKAAGHTPAEEPKPPAPREPEKHTYRKQAADPVVKNPGGSVKSRGGAASDQKGTVPELAIDLAGHTPETVAAHFGFVLAAQSFSGNTILGLVEDDRLSSITSEELGRFASRGRSAAGIDGEYTLKRQIAEALGLSFDDIGLIYLVPRPVDEAWIAWQRRVVQQSGYALSEVSRIDGRYGPDFNLLASALILQDGRVVRIQGVH